MRAYTLPPAIALCRKRLRRNFKVIANILSGATQWQALKILERLRIGYSKIAAGVMEVICQNQDIRNMQTQK